MEPQSLRAGIVAIVWFSRLAAGTEGPCRSLSWLLLPEYEGMKNPSSSSPIFNCNGSQNHLGSIVHFPTKSGHLSAETCQDVFGEPDIRLITIMLASDSIALLGGSTEFD